MEVALVMTPEQRCRTIPQAVSVKFNGHHHGWLIGALSLIPSILFAICRPALYFLVPGRIVAADELNLVRAFSGICV